MTVDPKQRLLKWYIDEYARRTAAVEAGECDISWVVPESRVSWTEVLAQAEHLGLKINHGDAIELRLWLASELEKL